MNPLGPLEHQSLLFLLIPILVLTGVAAGLLAGLLGVGGGIVVVPVLYFVFGFIGIDDQIRMHLAVGTSLATIVPTSFRSALSHLHKGSFDVELWRNWAPGVFVGVLFGTWLANRAEFSTLTAVFAVVALCVSLYMALAREASQFIRARPGGLATAGLTGIIGLLSAMMGIGGGTLSVPVMTLLGIRIHRAVGTAAGLGMVIAIPGTIGFMIGGIDATGLPPFSVGYVNWFGFCLIVPATVIAVPFGARLAHALNPVPLRRVFALFLVLTAVRMIADIL